MTRIIIALALSLTAALAVAQPTAEQREQLEQRLATVAERLQLTEEQKAQIEPIITDSFTQRQEILARYGIDPQAGSGRSGRPNPRTARKLRQEMESVRDATTSQMEAILDDEQLAEFARIQEESRAELRSQIRGGR